MRRAVRRRTTTPATTMLPEAAGPLYDRVKSYVLENIATGAFAPDARLPSEHELVAALGISRMTVHRALRELSAAGVLTRVQGVGTFVARPQPRSPVMEVRDIASEIRARGGIHSCRVIALEEIAPPPEITPLFGPGAPARVYHSVVVHAEDGAPVQVEERFVHPAAAPGYLEHDFSRITAHDHIQAHAPLTEVEHVVTATGADPVAAEAFGIPAGAPVLLLRRRTWSGPMVATVNRLTYPGDRYALADRRRVGGG
ncbi:histidine utilization repressor [Salinarimonas sp.]|uniref:histidine utilization repressor n=1 Tax=Salinarimonas sp. TaxID=2766526 RepID=UPI0032D8D0A8